MPSDSPPDEDRRRGPRVPLSVAFAETDPRTTTPVSNLSETGVFVETGRLDAVGTIIELCFAVFPDQPVLFVANGRVVRHGRDPAGMGVEFIELDENARAMIRELLSRDEMRRRRTIRARRLPTRKL